MRRHRYEYRQTSNINRTLVGNGIVDHSDAAPNISSISNKYLAYEKKKLLSLGFCATYTRGFTVC